MRKRNLHSYSEDERNYVHANFMGKSIKYTWKRYYERCMTGRVNFILLSLVVLFFHHLCGNTIHIEDEIPAIKISKQVVETGWNIWSIITKDPMTIISEALENIALPNPVLETVSPPNIPPLVHRYNHVHIINMHIWGVACFIVVWGPSIFCPSFQSNYDASINNTWKFSISTLMCFIISFALSMFIYFNISPALAICLCLQALVHNLSSVLVTSIKSPDYPTTSSYGGWQQSTFSITPGICLIGLIMIITYPLHTFGTYENLLAKADIVSTYHCVAIGILELTKMFGYKLVMEICK